MGLQDLIRRAAAAALVLAVAAPAAVPAQDRPRHPWTIPHVLRYATAEDVVGLNPHTNQQITLAYMSSLTMAWLLRYDARNRPIPELATAVPSRANGGISADGMTITYHLRHDATWSDGVPFTAEDVRFSVDVVRNPANNEGTHEGFDLVKRIDTPDPYTVVVHLSRPHAAFYVNFFGTAGGQPCILPKHLLAGLPNINNAPYNALPVGIGPFKYASWKRGDAVELVPDPRYFGRKPKLQRIIFKIIPDRNTVLTQLSTHEIDLWTPVPAAYFDRVNGISGVHVIRQASYLYNHLDFQLQHPVVADPVVRRALRLALDRRTILEKIRHGIGVLQETTFPPGHPFHIDVPLIPYDVAAANKLLDEGGWKRGADGIRAKDGVRLDLVVATGTGLPDTDAILELIRSSWSQLGVTMEVRHYPSPLFFAPANAGGIMYGGKFDVTFFAWIVNPAGDQTNFFGCDRFPPNGANDPRYCDRDVDRALARFDGSYDERVQHEASRFVQERVVRDAPTIVTDARQDVFASNDDLRGFHPNQLTPFDDLVDADI